MGIKKPPSLNRQRTGQSRGTTSIHRHLTMSALKGIVLIPQFCDGNSRCSLLGNHPRSVHCSQKVFGHASIIVSHHPTTLSKLSRAYLVLLKRIYYIYFITLKQLSQVFLLNSYVFYKFLHIY